MESAFGDTGEDSDHGVHSVLLFLVGVLDHVHTVPRKLSPEEQVDEVDLQDDVHQVEDLAEKKLAGIVLVLEPMTAEELHESGETGQVVLFLGARVSQLQSEVGHSPRLHGLPYDERQAKHQGLEEQDKAHPLVKSVLNQFVSWQELIDPRIDDFCAHGFEEGLRKGEGAFNPAVGVQELLWYVVLLDAHYRVAEELVSGHQDAGEE